MIKLTKHPLENRSYFISTDDNKRENQDQWTEIKCWLDDNAPGWFVSGSILTLPRLLPAVETYFALRFQ